MNGGQGRGDGLGDARGDEPGEDPVELRKRDETEQAMATNADPAEMGERLGRDIEQIRDNLGDLVGELDHRRHELFDWRLQIQRHGFALLMGTVAVAGLVVGGVAIHRARQPRHPGLSKRWEDLREGLALAVGGQRLAESRAKPVLAKRILGAAAVAVASVLARRLAERFLKPQPQPAR